MGFGTTLNGGSIQGASDVALSNPLSGHFLSYSASLQKWSNSPSPIFTAAISTTTNGTITLTAGTSAQLTKLNAILSGNVIVALVGNTANSVFELSFIATNFNTYTITIGTDVFSYPTVVKYVYIAGNWERVL